MIELLIQFLLQQKMIINESEFLKSGFHIITSPMKIQDRIFIANDTVTLNYVHYIDCLILLYCDAYHLLCFIS